MTDLTYASMTLEGVEQEKENAELLIPIGGNSYIKANLATMDKIVVGIGAGVSVEKSLQEAKSILKERLGELEKSARVAQQQFAQVAERIDTGRNRLEGLLSTLREEKAPSNV
jgi:prefoldin alpha subunit